jgi:hypothetical protein
MYVHTGYWVSAWQTSLAIDRHIYSHKVLWEFIMNNTFEWVFAHSFILTCNKSLSST